ncbi:hypothetical protein [Clostridium tagluense]|uniref:hypothetical protein n=2 Tax=Clostridium tagluense TaxID=360422 RepID=UPI001C0BEC02|nr:hypothetical protein [Clostridium tagluense]MBU3129788.1 hypothetical protein [Clostridium tagluense]
MKNLNPSYFRIKLSVEEAKKRLSNWWGVAAPTEFFKIDYSHAVANACDKNGMWRGEALYIYQNDEWAVFEDLSGGFGTIPATSWIEFAQKDSFVFAGYNDSIPYGELIIIQNGKVLREFMDMPDDPELNIDMGKLEKEEGKPIHSWVDVASYVDEDSIIYSDTGWLWIQ